MRNNAVDLRINSLSSKRGLKSTTLPYGEYFESYVDTHGIGTRKTNPSH